MRFAIRERMGTPADLRSTGGLKRRRDLGTGGVTV